MSRKKKNGSLIPWRGAALSIVIQFLLTALLAVLIGRGLLPISEAKLWEGAISLIAGTSAAMSCREGEGERVHC